MREILFRGRTLDGFAWAEGCLVHRTEYYGESCNEYFIVAEGDFDYDEYDSVEVDPETVGQYTGLKDKSGKKVFEGDIVEAVTVDTNEVRRTTIGIGLCEETVGDEEIMAVYCDYFGGPYAFPASMSEHFEVIGNIYDNPEMLKEGGEE